MPLHKVVLVVGTTTDYIEWIRQRLPGKALFLTDPKLRQNASEPNPNPKEELLCELSHRDHVVRALKAHLGTYALTLEGIFSYDCEAIPLAADLARHFNLPYCTPEAVSLCQNKFLSKQQWDRHNVLTPRAAHIESESDLVDFFYHLNKSCVVKPQNGTGSELVFLCRSEQECRSAYQLIQNGLKQKSRFLSNLDSEERITAEEYVRGEEFSCDFVVNSGGVQILRICRKILLKNAPVGTTHAYVLLPENQKEMDTMALKETLFQGARALKISHALCMADIMVYNHHLYLLEITPRPGGDCLPYLLKYARNIDMLETALLFAGQKSIDLPLHFQEKPVVGLRLHADRAGILDTINTEQLSDDLRILQVFLKRQSGHRIILPPDDYDSWVLGHVIFMPNEAHSIECQCQEIQGRIDIRVR